MAKDWKRVDRNGRSDNETWVKVAGLLFVAFMIAVIFFDPLTKFGGNDVDTETTVEITGTLGVIDNSINNQQNLDIKDRYLVYNDGIPTNLNVKAYDTTTETTKGVISSQTYSENSPKVSVSNAIWGFTQSENYYFSAWNFVSSTMYWTSLAMNGQNSPTCWDMANGYILFARSYGIGCYKIGGSLTTFIGYGTPVTITKIDVNPYYIVDYEPKAIQTNSAIHVFDWGSGNQIKQINVQDLGDLDVQARNLVYSKTTDKKVIVCNLQTGVSTEIANTTTNGVGKPQNVAIYGNWVVYNWYSDSYGSYTSGVYVCDLVSKARYTILDTTGSSVILGQEGLEVMANTVYFTRLSTLGGGDTDIWGCELSLLAVPEITHTPVTSAFTNALIPISARITDDIGVASATLYYKNVGALSFSSLAMIKTSGTFQDGVWEKPIPAQTSVGTAYYYISTTDMDTIPNTVTTPEYAVTIIPLDTTSPSITHTPISFSNVSVAILIEAQVTDNIAVNKVILYYKNVGAGSYVSTDMSKYSGTYQDGVWRANIPAQITGGIAYYYVWANDTSDNDVQTPAYMINIDTSAPIITHTPVTIGYLSTAIDIIATITDVQGVDVDEIVLKYRNAGQFVDIFQDMSLLSGNNTDGVWKGIIPAQTYDGTVPYTIYATDLSANTGNTVTFQIDIQASAPPLPPPSDEVGNVTGVVVNEDDEPIQGVRVTVEDTDITDTTDSDGVFNLIGVEVGAQLLNVSKSGYITQQVEADVEANTTITLSNITLVVGDDDNPTPTPAETNYNTYILIGAVVAIVAVAGVYLYKRKGRKRSKKWRR